MNRIFIIFFSLFMTVGLVSCDTMTKQDVGVVTGGAAGALLGSQIGSGSGQAVAIAVGAITGALIGGSIGQYMDRQDRQYVYQALENNRTTTWVNSNTGYQYTVTPTQTSGYCREYRTAAVIDGKTQTVYGKACRQPDGSWKTA